MRHDFYDNFIFDMIKDKIIAITRKAEMMQEIINTFLYV